MTFKIYHGLSEYFPPQALFSSLKITVIILIQKYKQVNSYKIMLKIQVRLSVVNNETWSTSQSLHRITKKKNQEVCGNLEYIFQTARFLVNLERKL